jgi:hypothetical protein
VEILRSRFGLCFHRPGARAARRVCRAAGRWEIIAAVAAVPAPD